MKRIKYVPANELVQYAKEYQNPLPQQRQDPQEVYAPRYPQAVVQFKDVR